MTTRWQIDPTMTLKASYVTTPQEVVKLTCDMTALLVDGGVPQDPPPQARLWRIVDNGADVEVTGLEATTITGNILKQRLPVLQAGEMYRLRWLIVTSGSTRAATTIIVCVE